MSAVRQAEWVETVVMEPLQNGDYREAAVSKCAFTCLGCGLVWAIRWHAETCEGRGHKATWYQEYPKGPVINGRPSRIDTYPRSALRRESVSPEAIASEADRLLNIYAASRRRDARTRGY